MLLPLISDHPNFQCYESLLIDRPKCTSCSVIAGHDPICFPSLMSWWRLCKKLSLASLIKCNTSQGIVFRSRNITPLVWPWLAYKRSRDQVYTGYKTVSADGFWGQWRAMTHAPSTCAPWKWRFSVDVLHHDLQRFSAEGIRSSTVIWAWYSSWLIWFPCTAAQEFLTWKGCPHSTEEQNCLVSPRN